MKPLDCILSATGKFVIATLDFVYPYRKVVSDVCIHQAFGRWWTGQALVTSGETTSVCKDHDGCVLRYTLWTVEVELLAWVGAIGKLFARCGLDVASVVLMHGIVCLHRRHQGLEDGRSKLR